jgi:surfeit locus 1 family protein
MKRRLPILATLVVLAAAALMIALGVWQLHRLAWKEGLIARFDRSLASPGEVAWPTRAGEVEGALYHRARIVCLRVLDASAVSGRSASGEAGLARVADCELAGGGRAQVVLGWSRAPTAPAWRGGPITGVIAPITLDRAKLVADPPIAGLGVNARPDPREIPNNHFAYAVQWFLFAGTALVIYGLALRKRLRG